MSLLIDQPRFKINFFKCIFFSKILFCSINKQRPLHFARVRGFRRQVNFAHSDWFLANCIIFGRFWLVNGQWYPGTRSRGKCSRVQDHGDRQRQTVAERCSRPEFRLYVQTFDHWKFCCWKDIVSVSLCRRFFYLSVCLNRGNWFQSEDGFSEREASQAANMGYWLVY